MRLLSTLVLALLLGGATQAAAAEPPELAKARTLYNAGSYDEAIAAASDVKSTEWLAAAQMVIARSYLDRYRRSSQPDDLVAGRRALVAAAAAPLMPRDRVDLLVGLGQSSYFSDEYGAAAGLFDNALAQGFLLNRQDRLLLLDWWATAGRGSCGAGAPQRPSEPLRAAARTDGGGAPPRRRKYDRELLAGGRREGQRGHPGRLGCGGRRVGTLAPVQRRGRHAARRSRSARDAGDHSGALAPAEEDADASRALRDQVWEKSIKEQWK